MSGRGLCDELITGLEEFYRLWCVVVCDLGTSGIGETLAHWGLLRQIKKKINKNVKCLVVLSICVLLVGSFVIILPSYRNKLETNLLSTKYKKKANQLF